MRIFFKVLLAIACSTGCVYATKAQSLNLSANKTTMEKGHSITVTITYVPKENESKYGQYNVFLTYGIDGISDTDMKYYIIGKANVPVSMGIKQTVSFVVSATDDYYEEGLDKQELTIKATYYPISMSPHSDKLIVNKSVTKSPLDPKPAVRFCPKSIMTMSADRAMVQKNNAVTITIERASEYPYEGNNSYTELLLTYKVNDEDGEISGDEIKRYINGPNVVYARRINKESTSFAIAATDAYYKDGLDKYPLIVGVSEKCNPYNKTELIINKQAPPPLHLSADDVEVSGGSSITVTVSIPKVNNGNSSIPVALDYSGNGKDYVIGAITSINILPGQKEVKLNIPIKKVNRKNQTVQLLARSKQFKDSNLLNIALLEVDKPMLTLSIDDSEVSGGSSVPVKINIPKTSKSKSTIAVTLTYSKDGAPYIINPVTAVTIQPNTTTAQFNIAVKDIVVGDEVLNIRAKSIDFKSSNSLDIQLLKNTMDLGNGRLTLPPLPKIKMKGDVPVLCSNQKTKVKSSRPLKGFWVSCKLEGTGFRQGINNRGETWTSSQDLSSGRIYLWIPMKEKNPFHYNATVEYKIGKQYVLNYGEEENISVELESGYRLGSSNSNNKNAITKNSAAHSKSDEIHFETGFQASAGLGGVNVASFGSVGAKQTTSEVFGFEAEESTGSTLGSTKDSHSLTRTTHTLKRKAPDAYGFRRGYIELFPRILYSLNDLDDMESIKIGDYIDYNYRNDVEIDHTYLIENDPVYRKKGIENYINYLFSVNPYKHKSIVDADLRPNKTYTKRMEKYLEAFPDVLSINSSLQPFLLAIKDYQYCQFEIRVEDYSVGLFDCVVNHSTSIPITVEVPVDCKPIEEAPHHQFTSQDNRVVSRFFWDASNSATDFQIEVKKKSDSWEAPSAVHIDKIKREYHPTTKYPIKTIMYDERTIPNDIHVIYEARIKSKCGPDSEWLPYSNSVTYTYDRSKYQVDTIDIVPILSTSNYTVTWSKVDGAEGYYVEYAKGDEDFSEARRILTPGPGKTHPFDVLHATNTWTYTNTGSNSFKIKVTPKCNGMKGIEKVRVFMIGQDEDNSKEEQEPANDLSDSIIEAPTYHFNEDSRLVLSWDTDYHHNEYLLEIKKKDGSWNKLYYTKIIKRTYSGKNEAPDAVELTITNKKFYLGEIYMARIKARNNSLSRVWSAPSLEVEFEGEHLNTKSAAGVITSSVSDFSQRSNVRSRRDVSELGTNTSSEVVDIALSIFPVPVTDFIQFSVSHTPFGEVEINVFDLSSGAVLHSERRVNIQKGEIINKNLGPGHYGLSVTFSNGEVLSEKFFKQ